MTKFSVYYPTLSATVKKTQCFILKCMCLLDAIANNYIGIPGPQSCYALLKSCDIVYHINCHSTMICLVGGIITWVKLWSHKE